jgi:glycosyltransferase involved in cell wall biosynthesis
VIVIDDGSRDDTRQVVERFGSPVRYFHQANAGVCAARNHGFRRARGEFVALLDSDDRWHPWKLARQVDVLRAHPEVGMVWTDMSAIDDTGAMIHPAYLRIFYGSYQFLRIEDIARRVDDNATLPGGAPAPVYKGDIFSWMLLGNLVHTSTVLLRRDRLTRVGGFDESLRVSGEDYEFHLHTCFHGPVAFIDAASTLYRIGAADQLTAPHLTIHIARNNLRTVLGWLARGAERLTLSPGRIAARLAQAHGWVGEEELRGGNRRAARQHLWKSLRLKPRQARMAMLFLFSMLPPAFFDAALRTRRIVGRTVRGGRTSADADVPDTSGGAPNARSAEPSNVFAS